MRYVGLSGISPHKLKELEHETIKTIEVRSTHNFLSALETDVGDIIVLTSTSLGDVRPGTTGVIAKILEKQIAMHSCGHMACALAGGTLKDYIIKCPCHDWRYDFRTGEFLDAKEIKLPVYEWKSSDGKIFIKIQEG
ncbi:MAG: DUF473 family protein [Candidatus Methanoperedens sp.]|nr:DUF473 family protein [Candidatus Methanoperedens sp.]